jgi:hypothetical protein
MIISLHSNLIIYTSLSLPPVSHRVSLTSRLMGDGQTEDTKTLPPAMLSSSIGRAMAAPTMWVLLSAQTETVFTPLRAIAAMPAKSEIMTLTAV